MDSHAISHLYIYIYIYIERERERERESRDSWSNTVKKYANQNYNGSL
jgi:hypothetical protein